MFESVEEMLESPDYDEDLQKELSAACPNYMTYFLTAKRDLLRNDCGIVVTGSSRTHHFFFISAHFFFVPTK